MRFKGDVVTFINDDGHKEVFEYVDWVEYQENEYLIMHPYECETEDELVIMKVENSDTENEYYAGVNDDETIKAVYDIYIKALEELQKADKLMERLWSVMVDE